MEKKFCFLKQDRKLCYEIFGSPPEESTRVLFFLAGSPGGRLFFPKSHHDNCVARKITVYTFDRPGKGGSSKSSSAIFTGFADDLHEFSRQMKISTISGVVGYSGIDNIMFDFSWWTICISMWIFIS